MELKNFGDIHSFLLKQTDNRSEYTVLVEDTLGISKQDLILRSQTEIDTIARKRLKERFQRFEEGAPVQYILGKWEFLGREYAVGEGVLIPREDTGTVIELAREMLGDTKKKTFADLGSGSGCIAITLAADCKMQGYAVEMSDKAYDYLSQNLKMAESSIEPVLGDMFSYDVLEKLPPLDLVISNPPYITGEEMEELDKRVLKEPESALFGGSDGLCYYRKIAKVYKEKLKEGAVLCFEVGFRQADSVLEILKNAGYKNLCEKKDFNGIRRAVGAVK